MYPEVITGHNVNELFVKCARALRDKGLPRNSRNGRVLELSPCILVLEDPTNNMLALKGRKSALWAALAECFWVYAGRADMEYLSMWLKRAKNYSDDGYIWTRAYGPKVARNIPRIIELLRRNPDERRAVLTIWNSEDTDLAILGGKDVSCTMMVQYYIVEGKLNCYVSMRSNDLLFGALNINVLEWTILQQIIANTLGIPVGRYYHFATSLHLYEQFADRANVEYEDTKPFPILANYYNLTSFLDRWFCAVRIGKSCTILKGTEQSLETLGQFSLAMLTCDWTMMEYLLTKPNVKGTAVEKFLLNCIDNGKRYY